MSGHGQLDIVLAGAEDDIVLQIQRELLSKPGGDLRDPAWIPFAAARRCQLEAERIIPRWLAAGATDAADVGASAFEARVTETVRPILKDLAEKAARTFFSDWRTQHIRLMSMIYATACLVGGVLLDKLIIGSFTLPAEVAEYVRNGNRIEWLPRCVDSLLKQIDGRAACNFVVYLEPPSQPFAYGPLADYQAVAQLLPFWIQWAVIGILGCIALALFFVPFHSRIAIRISAYVRFISWFAGAALFVWLLSVIRPWL